MKAMIFAAGLGTRLRPLTDDRPKALVEVGGMPLLEIAIRRLMYFGCRDILVNIHHFGEQILSFLESRQNFGIRIVVSDERALLLDTGGGLKQAAWFFQDGSFLVHNADIISDLDLGALHQAHLESGALATLAVRQRASSRYLLFDAEGQLAGWRHAATGQERICRAAAAATPLAFSGIYALSPDIFRHMPAAEVFSIIEVFLEAGREERILAYQHDDSIWLDVGKPSALEQAQALIKAIPLA